MISRAESRRYSSALKRALEEGPGARAELRRLLTHAPVPTAAYWQLSPPRAWPRELPMWLAGLAARAKSAKVAWPREEEHPAAATIAQSRSAMERSERGSVAAFDRHLSRLLEAHPDDLLHALVPVVELSARVEGIAFDYGELLYDLSRWDLPERSMQRRWAEEIWAPTTPKLEEEEGNDQDSE